MQQLLAIAGLTVKAAFRFRLVVLLSIVLLGGVVLLPLVIEHDGTARGFAQIVLTYTLTMITALLGFATLWLAVGTLARDVEESQIQMVAVKPIPRWKIWLGKLVGILVVDALLLGLSSGAVFFLLQYRAKQLPEAQRNILQNEILVARGSARPPLPDYQKEAEQFIRERLKDVQVEPANLDYIRQQVSEQVKANYQVVPPDFSRTWEIDLGLASRFIRDRPLFLRVKFNTAQPTQSSSSTPPQTFAAYWVVGEFESPNAWRSSELSLASDTFHELRVPPNLFDDSGKLKITFVNRNQTVLLFPLEDGIEVLYREGGFALNYVRGVGIIFCWMALLGAIGLMSASFLSFPVAAFLSIGILVVGLSSGTIALILEQGTVFEVNPNTGAADEKALLDHVALPMFKGLLTIIQLARDFSPIELLSSGRSISWTQLGTAIGQICFLLGGVFALVGIVSFTRRELATAQGTQ